MAQRKIPSKVRTTGAGKSVSKRVPKKQPSAPLSATVRELQQRTKNLLVLQKQLAQAQRSASRSRKPDSIKESQRFLRAAEKEFNKELRQTVKTATAAERFINVFTGRNRKVKPAQKAAVTKAKNIVQASTPVVKRVPKKKTAKKTSTKKTSTKTTKPATKTAKKIARKRAAKKAAGLPAQVVARSQILKTPQPVPKPIVLAVREGEDYNYPLAPNEHTGVRVRKHTSDVFIFNTLEEAVEAMDTYTEVDDSDKEVVTIAFRPKASGAEIDAQIRSIKAGERRRSRAEWREKQKKERAAKRADKKRIRELEKQLKFERSKNKKGGK
jgi:hypothetical protein